MASDGDTDDKPHHLGHRARLRERFARDNGASMADYELLELFLFRSIPRQDIKQIAKDLLAEFKSFEGVMTASPERLRKVRGVGDVVIQDLKIVQAAATRLVRDPIHKRDVISSWNALLDYCRAAMAHEPTEHVRVLFLDAKNQLIADEVQGKGTVDHTPVYPRAVVKRALELDAKSLILVHNHPSGDPTPSRTDIEMTKEIVEAARALKISVHDHVVIGRNAHASFRALGLL